VNPDNVDIGPLFPPCVLAQCIRITDDAHYPLYPGELEAVCRAVEKRRCEFAAGRACARRILERLGFINCAIPRGNDGEPVWPYGITGSISHSHTWCAAAAGPADEISGLGLDIETIARVHPSIARKVLTPEESASLADKTPDAMRASLAIAFSAKEAVYKCLHPFIGRHMGFQDAVIIPDHDQGTFKTVLTEKITAQIPSGFPLRGRFLIHDGNIFTAAVLESQPLNLAP